MILHSGCCVDTGMVLRNFLIASLLNTVYAGQGTADSATRLDASAPPLTAAVEAAQVGVRRTTAQVTNRLRAQDDELAGVRRTTNRHSPRYPAAPRHIF